MKYHKVEHCNDCKYFGEELNTCEMKKNKQLNKYIYDEFNYIYFIIPKWCPLPDLIIKKPEFPKDRISSL